MDISQSEGVFVLKEDRRKTKGWYESKCDELQRQVAILEKLAYYDETTGLYRNGFFKTRAQAALDQLAATSKPATILYIDLDNFKGVNDAFGHSAGDKVLKRISTVLRKYDIAGRVGGDEFMILLPGTDLLGAETVAKRIRGEVEGMRLESGEGKIVTLSVGLCSTTSVGYEFSNLSEQADGAMYKAKEEGRNRVVCFDA